MLNAEATSMRHCCCLAFVLLLTVCSFQAQASDPPAIQFGERVDLGLVEYAAITEASGIVASRKNPGVLWVHNDSGQDNVVYALTTQGKHLGSYKLQGVKNRDWEDIALGPGPQPGQHYLYIGEIGDNRARYDRKYIYRVAEPRVTVSQTPGEWVLSHIDTIPIRYADGRRDAETLFIDPLSKDLYIVSKREAQVGVYRAPYPQSTTNTTTLERVATLSLNKAATNGAWLVGGDMSPAGTAILLKSYLGVYYWARTANQSVPEALAAAPLVLPYFPEPQGEAISWAADEDGYYTVSEEKDNIAAHLYFYPRLHASSVSSDNGTKSR